MKIYTFTQARERLATLLEKARKQEVIIRCRNGEQFSIVLRQRSTSPFDVASVNTGTITQDVLDAIRESRERG